MGFWNSNLVLNIPYIDEQHKEFFKYTEKFIVSIKQNKAKYEIEALFQFLKLYSVQHFHYEEEFQQAINYPNKLVHKKNHDNFVDYIEIKYEEYSQSGYNIKLVLELAEFIIGWLKQHITKEDYDIAVFIRNNPDLVIDNKDLVLARRLFANET